MTGPLASLSENKSFSSSDRRKNTAAGTKNTGVHSSRPRETCSLTGTSRAIPLPALQERNVLITSCLASSAWLGALSAGLPLLNPCPRWRWSALSAVPVAEAARPQTACHLERGPLVTVGLQIPQEPAWVLCPQQPIASGSLLLIRSDAGLSREGSAALAWETSSRTWGAFYLHNTAYTLSQTASLVASELQENPASQFWKV